MARFTLDREFQLHCSRLSFLLLLLMEFRGYWDVFSPAQLTQHEIVIGSSRIMSRDRPMGRKACALSTATGGRAVLRVFTVNETGEGRGPNLLLSS